MNDVVLETERLILRQPLRGDLEALAVMMADPEVMRHMGGVRPLGEAWRSLAMSAGGWALDGCAFFTVVEKASGAVVGMTGPWNPPDWPGPEVGWMFSRSVWGRGYATEAARRVLDWVFEELRWRRVIHIILEDNKPSQAVAERIGSRIGGAVAAPGAAPGAPPQQVPYWEQTRAEWRDRRDSRGVLLMSGAV